MLSALGLTLLVTEVIGGAIDKTDSKTDPPTHLSMVLEIWFIFSKLYLFSYTYLVWVGIVSLSPKHFSFALNKQIHIQSNWLHFGIFITCFLWPSFPLLIHLPPLFLPPHTPVLQECSLHLAVIGSLRFSFFLQTRDCPVKHGVSGSDLLLLIVRKSCRESDFGFGLCQRNAKDRDEMTPQGEVQILIKSHSA